MFKTQNIHGKNLFSSQVYDQKLIGSVSSSKRLNLDLRSECLQVIRSDDEGHNWSEEFYHEGYTTYGSNKAGFDRMHKVSSTFAELEKKIDQHVKKFIKLLDYDACLNDFEMTQCWINIMPLGSLHTSHIHPLSVISGTYYVTTPKACGYLKFEDPRLSQFMNTPNVIPSARPQNQRLIALEPKAEHVVLFESFMKHEVTVNRSKKERISISFNYGWKK